MKPLLKARRPSPAEALAIATSAAPAQPPAQVVERAPDDGPTTLNLRMRKSTVAAIETAAREKGQTMKQIVSHALAGAGVSVAPEDLEDRTSPPSLKRMRPLHPPLQIVWAPICNGV